LNLKNVFEIKIEKKTTFVISSIRIELSVVLSFLILDVY
jgi:hypothetical protein